MKKSIKYTAIALSIVLVLVIAVPFLIPLNSFKAQIQGEIRESTGRELSIEGDIKLHILPYVGVSISKVKLASISGGQAANLVEVENVKASLSLLKLLTGKIEVSNVTLDKPVISLEVLKDNRKNWEFANAKKNESNSLELPMLIDVININDGKLIYIEGSNKTKVEGINTSLKIKDVRGPIDFYSSLNINGVGIKLNGKVAKLDQKMPISATLEAMGEKIEIKGDFDVEKGAFLGSVEADGDLTHFVNDLPKALQDKIKLSSKIAYENNTVKLTDTSISIGKISGKGGGVVNISKKSANMSVSIMPGDLDVSLYSDDFTSPDSGKIKVHAKNLKAFLDAIKIDTKDLPDLIEKEFIFATQGAISDDKITLKNIEFKAGSANLSGLVTISKSKDGDEYNYELSTTNAKSLARVAKVSLPVELDRVRVVGNTKKVGNKFITDSSIYAAWSEANIVGSVGADAGKKVNLKLAFSGSNFARTYHDLTKSNALAGATQYAINADIEGDLISKVLINLKDSAINMGGETVKIDGKYDLNFNGMSMLNLDIHANTIRLGGGDKSEGGTQGKARWSQEKIDLVGLKNIEGALKININKLIKDHLELDKIKGEVTISGGVLKLDRLNATLEGGSLNASGSLSSADSQPMQLDLEIKNAHLSNLIPSKSYKITQGTLNLDMSLKSSGKSQLAYIENLGGKIDFNSTNGKISGFNLQKAKEAISNLKTLDSIISVLNTSFEGGETAYKSLVGKMTVKQGIVNIDQFTLDAVDAKANAKGIVDLPNYTLDVNAVIEMLFKNIPPIGARLYGSLDDPSHKLDTSALQDYLLSNVLKGVTDGLKNSKGGKPEDLIKGLIGIGR